MTYKVGNVIRFEYDGNPHWVRIDSIKTGYRYLGLIGPVPYLITGWDYEADYPIGGHRSFKVDKIVDVTVVHQA